MKARDEVNMQHTMALQDYGQIRSDYLIAMELTRENRIKSTIFCVGTKSF